MILLVLLVAPKPLSGRVTEDVMGGDLLVVSAEVEANKFVFAELIESPTPAVEVPPKLNPPLSDDLLALLEGLGLIEAPPNPAKGKEGPSVFAVLLKSDLGNKFAADDPEAASPPDDGNDAPNDEPNMLILYITSRFNSSPTINTTPTRLFICFVFLCFDEIC